MGLDDPRSWSLIRRRFIAASAASVTTLALIACEESRASPSVAAPARTGGPGAAGSSPARPAVPSEGGGGPAGPAAGASGAPNGEAPTSAPTLDPTASPSPSAGAASGRVLFRDAALADGRSAELRVGVSVLVRDGRIAWIRPRDAEEDPGPRDGLEVVDASGATIVPGMVDGHSHVTGPGGANWISRFRDPPDRLLATAEENGRLAARAGVRWLRDVGAPRVVDPVDGRERALSLGIRDRWAGRRDMPTICAAGTWLMSPGILPPGLAVEVADGNALVAAALGQLDDGADLVKLYLDSVDPAVSPWSAAEVRRVVEAVHARGARVTAHSSRLDGARVGADAGVDALEHGFELDEEIARTMAANGVRLVSTLTVMHSWLTFGRTTTLDRFTAPASAAGIRQRLETAEASIRLARAAGVPIAAGTDFGGGSPRAGQLAWEVKSLVRAGLEPWDSAPRRGGAGTCSVNRTPE